MIIDMMDYFYHKQLLLSSDNTDLKHVTEGNQQ